MSLKKRNVLFILGTLICICTMIGVSYAYWRLVLVQKETNKVVSDCFKVTFSDENPIQLENAYPLSDEELYEYFKAATPYHFTVTNTCSSWVQGYINLETLPVEGKALNDEYISLLLYDGNTSYSDLDYDSIYYPRFYDSTTLLINANINSYKVILDSIAAYKLAEFTLEPNEEKSFNLLLWMDGNTPVSDEVMNANWEEKITITTSYIESEDPELLLHYDYELYDKYTADVDLEKCFAEISSERDETYAKEMCDELQKKLKTGVIMPQESYDNVDFLEYDFVNNVKTEKIAGLCNYKKGGTYINEQFDYLSGEDMNPVLPYRIDIYPVAGVSNCPSGISWDSDINSFNGIDFNTYTGYAGTYLANKVINSITLSDNILFIEGYSFYGNRLKSIEFSENLLSIGEAAFQKNLLTKVELNSKETLTINARAFMDNQIEEIILNGDIVFNYKGRTAINANYLGDGIFTNNPVTKIVNNTGKAYNWSAILTGVEGDEFETGSIEVDGRTVQIVKE